MSESRYTVLTNYSLTCNRLHESTTPRLLARSMFCRKVASNRLGTCSATWAGAGSGVRPGSGSVLGLEAEAGSSAQGSVVVVHTSSVMAQSDCSMAFSLVERSA